MDETYKLVEGFVNQYQLKNPFIGISSAGVVDSDLGQIIYTGPTIPNYDGTQFFDVFKDLSDDIAVYNDVDAALLGEIKLHRYEEDHIFCLTLGTGIGGAFYSEALVFIKVHVTVPMKLVTYSIVKKMVKHMSNVPQHQHLKI